MATATSRRPHSLDRALGEGLDLRRVPDVDLVHHHRSPARSHPGRASRSGSCGSPGKVPMTMRVPLLGLRDRGDRGRCPLAAPVTTATRPAASRATSAWRRARAPAGTRAQRLARGPPNSRTPDTKVPEGPDPQRRRAPGAPPRPRRAVKRKPPMIVPGWLIAPMISAPAGAAAVGGSTPPCRTGSPRTARPGRTGRPS